MATLLATLLPWAGFLAGFAIVLATISSIINTIITPRSISSRITRLTWQAVRWLFLLITTRLRRYETKDRVLAYFAPLALLVALVTWLLLFLLGYALLFWPLLGGDFGTALQLSGSSLFTLGVASSPRAGPVALEFLTAATGVITVALQIGYLPTLYGSYNRREALVTALGSRGGTPPWGPEILARHHLSESLGTLPALYAAWESWSADMAESHTSYPWLLQFRSPNRLNSWIVALLALLDSAALYHAIAPSRCPAEGRQAIRMGYTALRSVGGALGMPINEDPRPDDPLQLTFEEFAAGVEILRRVGFPIERTAEEAWPHFRGWRVNYEELAYALAAEVVAVPAPWSGKRALMTHQERFDLFTSRPRHRTPDDPDANRARRSVPGDPLVEPPPAGQQRPEGTL